MLEKIHVVEMFSVLTTSRIWSLCLVEKTTLFVGLSPDKAICLLSLVSVESTGALKSHELVVEACNVMQTKIRTLQEAFKAKLGNN